jgi:ribosomal protein S18 acetylase RimI-like enzyme
LKSSDIEIRRLRPADAVAYRELPLRGLREHPDAFTSSYEEEVDKPLDAILARLGDGAREAVYGAFDAGALVGVVGIGREPRAKNRHKATVFGMYVAPERAGRGIGRRLLQRVVDEAMRMDGLDQLILTVTQSNAAARALYEKSGFRSFGVEPRAICVGDTHFDKNHMILFLGQ